MPLAIHDLSGTVQGSNDLVGLRSLLDALLDEPVIDLQVVYPDEVTLHLGRPVERRHQRAVGEVRGSFILGTSASGWRFQTTEPPYLVARTIEDDGPGLSTAEKREIERLGAGLRGLRVVAIEVSPVPVGPSASPGIALAIRFRDGASFAISPSPDPEDFEGEIPDWELMTPFGYFLEVGPGLKWSYLPDGSQAANPPAGSF